MLDTGRSIPVEIYIVLCYLACHHVVVNYSETRKARLRKISEKMNRVVDAHIRTVLEEIFIANVIHHYNRKQKAIRDKENEVRKLGGCSSSQETTESLEVWHVYVIASAVDLVFRLHRCMPDASRDISAKIYIVLFPTSPSAISPVIMSFSFAAIVERNSARYTATVECNATRCQRIATVQCHCCKVFGWCRLHINYIRWYSAGKFKAVCDQCYVSFEKSDTESDTPPRAKRPRNR